MHKLAGEKGIRDLRWGGQLVGWAGWLAGCSRWVGWAGWLRQADTRARKSTTNNKNTKNNKSKKHNISGMVTKFEIVFSDIVKGSCDAFEIVIGWHHVSANVSILQFHMGIPPFLSCRLVKKNIPSSLALEYV